MLFDQCKCRYYKAFNTVFSKVGRFASKEVVLDLIRNKCLYPCCGVKASPICLYGLLDYSYNSLFVPRVDHSNMDHSSHRLFVPWTVRTIDLSYHGPFGTLM